MGGPRKATAPEPEPVEPDTAEVTAPDEGETPEPEPVDVTPTTVAMRIAISGTRDGEPWPRVGDTIDLPADEAERLVRLGYADLPD